MPAFIRRFTQDPGNEVLLEIESVNILDLDPPATISGIGTGTAILVGEFEDGDYAKPIQLAGTDDLARQFGGFGYNYNGVVGNNPSARARRADSTLTTEYWNGNAAIQLNGKRFRRLICTRVDTSIGAVSFSRQAFVVGAAAFAYNLEPAQVLSLDIGAGPVSTTFTAAAAQLTGTAGVFPTTFVGGETLTVGYDDVPDFTVTFLAADQTRAQCITRINAYAGFTFASDTGSAIRFTSRQRGTGAQSRVISASAGSVLTALGLSAGTTAVGTGNVANIDAVTFNEVKIAVELAVAGVKVELDDQGRPRASKTFVATGDYIQVGTATTATALGFVIGDENSNDGLARYLTTAGTYATLFAGGETLTLAIDDRGPVVITFLVGDQSQAQVISRINLALGATVATSATSTKILFTGLANGGRIRVLGASTGVLGTLGMVAGTTQTALVLDGVIQAGTQVQNTAADRVFVTTQTIPILSTSAGPYVARVRHALDDGSGLSATAGSVTIVATAIALGSFFCQNLSQINAALTETQIDAAYGIAMDATKNPNSTARTASIMWSARQSNQCRRALRSNAIDASAKGLFGRVAPIRPPLGSTPAVVMSISAEPGCGAYRSDRVVYNYPGAATFVPPVALRGTGGGAGFTATGIVDVGSDGFLSSILSQLPPEENPGQLTSFLDAVVGLESSANVQNFTMDNYIAFKSAGICALRIDEGNAIFQSGVVNVDPSVYPNLKNIARRRMADFIQDSLARRAKFFSKKLSTNYRRKALAAEQVAFMETLLSKSDPARQRIAGYAIDTRKGNTDETLALGLYRLIIRVRTLASLDSIVLQTTIGESVTEVEELPQAA